MYTIKSSDFFKKGGINTALTAIEVVKNIADDYSSDHRLYVIYALNYKIEFSSNENTSIHYLMVEKFVGKEKYLSPYCMFIDDMSIFDKTLSEIVATYKKEPNEYHNITIGDAVLCFDNGKVDSLYYLP